MSSRRKLTYLRVRTMEALGSRGSSGADVGPHPLHLSGTRQTPNEPPWNLLKREARRAPQCGKENGPGGNIFWIEKALWEARQANFSQPNWPPLPL